MALTPKECTTLLILFKDFSTHYNANTLAQKISITRAGALKILTHLKKLGLLADKKYGRSTFYKVNLTEPYAGSVMEMLLRGEAREIVSRWIWEFQDFYPLAEIVVLFGSVVRNYEKANDIDLLLAVSQKQVPAVQNVLVKHRRISMKPIHLIWQSPKDLERNLKKPDPVLVNALRFGYILHGYNKLIDVVKKAQEAHGLFAVPEPERR